MPQDHFVAQTYLNAFADPATIKDPEKGGLLHAYDKAGDGRHFCPSAVSICKTLDWDRNQGKFQNAEKYIPLIKAGRLRSEVDSNYPKAIATTQLLQHFG
jgi:hypothetical protein